MAIEFLQENPKRVDSLPWQRYEKYKVAKTWQEAKDLGAYEGDLKHDRHRGYLQEIR